MWIQVKLLTELRVKPLEGDFVDQANVGTREEMTEASGSRWWRFVSQAETMWLGNLLHSAGMVLQKVKKKKLRMKLGELFHFQRSGRSMIKSKFYFRLKVFFLLTLRCLLKYCVAVISELHNHFKSRQCPVRCPLPFTLNAHLCTPQRTAFTSCLPCPRNTIAAV